MDDGGKGINNACHYIGDSRLSRMMVDIAWMVVPGRRIMVVMVWMMVDIMGWIMMVVMARMMVDKT